MERACPSIVMPGLVLGIHGHGGHAFSEDGGPGLLEHVRQRLTEACVIRPGVQRAGGAIRIQRGVGRRSSKNRLCAPNDSPDDRLVRRRSGGAGARESTNAGSPKRCSCERPPRRFLDPRTACGRIAAVRRCTPDHGSLTRAPATGVVVLVYHGPAVVRDRRSTSSPMVRPDDGPWRRRSPSA